MISVFLSRLIARYGVLPLAIAGFILLIILMFGSIAGISKIKANWYEHKAEKLDVKARQSERAAQIAKADTKQTQKAADIAADTTRKQDQTATGQRQNTAKAIEVIHERIIKVPVTVLPATDPVVFEQVREARGRALAAANHLSGTQGN